MANLPLAFAELLIGAILVDAAVKGSSVSDVVQGKAQQSSIGSNSTGSGGGGATTSTSSTASGGSVGGKAAPANVGSLTSSQQTFAGQLASDTGLNVNVIAAWLLAEESGVAATARQAANNNDWLNIGYTDSGTYGAVDQIWSDPVSAANATAAWLKGQSSIPGYGPASAGIRSILSTAGKSVSAQIAAIQHSGWASSGYPDLVSIYNSVIGSL